MAEYPMDIGSNLPPIHQELMYAARSPERMDPWLAQHLARTLEQRHTELWERVEVVQQPEELPQGILGRIRVLGRSMLSIDMSQTDQPNTSTEAHVPVNENGPSLRHWLAGHAAMLGIGVSAIRRPRADDDVLG